MARAAWRKSGAASTVAGPVLATTRAASSGMELVTRLAGSEPLLLVESGSSVAASARATLSKVPVVGAMTVTVRDRLAPLARLGADGQVTTPAARLPALLAESKVTPAGSVSRTTTEAAVEGPLLVTVIVYVKVWTASTEAGPVFVTARLTSSWTVVVTRLPDAEPLLLEESGSMGAASERATLSSVPVVGAVTVAVRDRLAPLARLATAGQVTTPPASVPPLLAEMNVTLPGSVSRTTTVEALDGPLLVTVMV